MSALEGSSMKPPAPALRLVPSADAPLSPEQQELVLSVRSHVSVTVRRLVPYATEADQADIAGRAYVVVSLAARMFDPSTGARFISYATPFIVGKVIDLLGREHRYRRFLRAARAAARRHLSEEPENPCLINDDQETSKGRIDALAAQYVDSLVAGAVAAQLEPEEALAEHDALGTAVGVVYEAVARMNDEDRRLFHLRFEQGREQKEIMAALGMSERTVRRHLVAMTGRLREALGARGFEEPPWRT